MKQSKLKYLALATLVAACNTPEEFNALPKPASLEYGQPMSLSQSGQSTDGTDLVAADDWKTMAKLEVGRKPYGSTSISQIWVKNTGDLPASLEKMWMDPKTQEMFKISSECGSTIPGKQACLVNIMYSPNTVGETPSDLNIAYENGEGGRTTTTLPVMATASNLAFLQFEKDKIEIQNTTVGYSLTGTFKVLYNGSSLKAKGLSIQPARGITISNPSDGSFEIDKAGTTCGETIEADCIIKVKFAPGAEGLVSSTFGVNYFNGAEVLKINGESQGSGLKAEVLATLSSALTNFGSVVANPAAPKIVSVPVSFVGSVPAEKVSIKAPGTGAFEIINDPSKTTCSSKMISGNCVLAVAFDPSSVGSYQDTIQIDYSSQGQPRESLKISLTGAAVNPAKILSDVQSVSFGDVPAYKKVTKSFVLSNKGDVAISNLSAVKVVGASYTAAFEQKCSSLAPNDSCKLNVSYQIKSEASENGEFSFSYYDGRQTQQVALSASGKGTSPLVLEASTTIDFGDIMINHPALPAAKSWGISIFGTTPLTNAAQLIFPAPLTSPFSSTLGNASNCKAPLDPNKSNNCSFSVSVTTNTGLTPDVLISQPFSLSYEGDGKKGAGKLNFTVKMTPRKAPELAFTSVPVFKTVSVKDSSQVTLVMKNNSAYFGTAFKSADITGDSGFSIVSNGCNGGVAKNATCNIVVKFAPTEAKKYSAKLRYIYHNQIANQTIEANLVAEGSKDVTLLADATEINFGSVYVGDKVSDKVVNLKYFGATDWTHSAVLGSPFKVEAVNCGEESDCKLSVGFTPSAAGDFERNLEFTYSPALNANPGKIRILVKGKAVLRVPSLSLTPSSFPKTLVGENKSLVVTIKNNGTTAAQNVSFGSLAAPFRFADDGAPGASGMCPSNGSIDPSKSCTLKVIFEPSSVGKAEVELAINYDSGSGSTQSVKPKISGLGTQMIQVFAGAFQSCIINELGKAQCWGRNSQGQLGLGHNQSVNQKISALPALNFGSDAVVKKMAIGDSHACAIVDKSNAKGLVVCWGNNANGKLGLGHTRNTNSPLDANGKLAVVSLGTSADLDAVVDVVAGFEHTCALQKSGELKCWGGNTSGQLGNESTSAVGSNLAQMGDSFKPISIGGRGLASISKVKSISAGSGHTCAVLESGTSLCWGDNFYGQLGQGSEAEKIGTHSGDLSTLSPINFGRDFVAKNMVASSGAFSCALSINGDVKCFGKTVANEKTSNPFFGVLGNCWGRQMQNTSAVSCSSSMAPTTSVGYMPSDMGDKLPKINFGSSKVVQLATGSTFGCALLDDKSVKCWGTNDNGQLGLGNTQPIGANALDMGDSMKAALTFADGEAIQVATGYEHACVVLKNNTVKCWGSSFENVSGLAGNGIAYNTGTKPSTLPKVLPLVYDGR